MPSSLKESAIGDLSVELDSRILHPAKGTRLGMACCRRSRPCSALRRAISFPASSSPRPCRSTGCRNSTEFSTFCAASARREPRTRRSMPSASISIPEIPRQDAETLTAFMKSFVLLNPWLRRRSLAGPTRDLLGFADPFPGRLRPQARGAGLLAGHRPLHRRLSGGEPHTEPRPRSSAAPSPPRCDAGAAGAAEREDQRAARPFITACPTHA